MVEYAVTVYDDRACEYAGAKHWHLNGKLHREDGPAIEWPDGDKFWYLNGRQHREDGPAVERADGTKFWYLNGERLTEDEFNKRIHKEVVLTMDEIAEQMGIPVGKLKIKK